ncbi:MAG: prepilin-type N-terminal cleavage/methylation domain-containing protein [Parvibaculaceae bacterium]
MSARRDEAQEGTTLIELLVALSLLALLSVYAVGAIRYLQNFDRVEAVIEDRAVIEAARTHLRRSIEAMQIAFIVKDGTSPRLAFAGGKNSVTFVTPADSRLDYGGLYLVRFGLSEETSGMHPLVTARRAFRPRMDLDMTGGSLTVLDKVATLNFSYFGSPQEGSKPEWYENWPETNVLPQAIRVDLVFGAQDQRAFPPLEIPIAVAK